MAATVRMMKRSSKITLVAVVLSSIALIAAFFSFDGLWRLMALTSGHNVLNLMPPSQGRLDRTKANAAIIIEALEAYRGKRGEYPASLDMLVPEVLSHLPAPEVGIRNWDYRRPHYDRFTIDIFIGPTYEHEWWDQPQGVWRGDQ